MLRCNIFMKQAAMCEYQISFYEFSVGPHGFHCKSRVSDLPKHADPFAPKIDSVFHKATPGRPWEAQNNAGFSE